MLKLNEFERSYSSDAMFFRNTLITNDVHLSPTSLKKREQMAVVAKSSQMDMDDLVKAEG